MMKYRWSLLSAILLVLGGCNGGTSSDQTGSGGAMGEASGGNGGAPGGAGDSAVHPTPDCGPPADLGVRIVGRHDGCTDGAVRMAWSGTGFVARFEGTGLSFVQSGYSVEYTVVVDGEVQEKLVTTAGEGTYVVAEGLPSGEHTVEIYRRGEASFGTVTLHAVEVTDGELREPPPRPGRRIEIFGDSITCGYGNEGTDASCSFSADTENHYLSYGAVLARSLDAELSTVAWSGKGVVVNYGGDMSTPLSQMLDRAVGSPSTSVWDYTLAPEPDLVLFNLGTNDFSTDNDPADETFTDVYATMLEAVRARYPSAYLMCTVGPLLGGTDLMKARSGIEAAIARRVAAGDDRISAFTMTTGNPSPGCDWHPSIATHAAMASELEPAVRDAVGW